MNEHCEATAPAWSVEAVTVPPGSGAMRNPRVVVGMRLGAVVLGVAVARRHRGRFQAQFPTLPGTSEPAVTLAEDLAAEIEAAAVDAALADPRAGRLLRGRE